VAIRIRDPDTDPDPYPYRDTGKTCTGGGMHYLSASSVPLYNLRFVNCSLNEMMTIMMMNFAAFDLALHDVINSYWQEHQTEIQPTLTVSILCLLYEKYYNHNYPVREQSISRACLDNACCRSRGNQLRSSLAIDFSERTHGKRKVTRGSAVAQGPGYMLPN